jgi:hypothetical protein
MRDKAIKKTKAELHAMLAEAVRNTQPQPIRDAQPEPKRRPPPKRTAKIKKSSMSPSFIGAFAIVFALFIAATMVLMKVGDGTHRRAIIAIQRGG